MADGLVQLWILFIMTHTGKPFVQINLVSCSNDRIAEQQFFVRMLYAHSINRIFDTKDKLKDIFKFHTEVVVCNFRSIDFLLQLK